MTSSWIFVKKSRQSFFIILCLFWIMCFSSVFIEVSAVNSDPNLTPAPRYGHKMIFDSLNDQLVLFGGSNYDQITLDSGITWVYSLSNSTWNYIYSSSSPSARINHGMIYIPLTQEILLYGGISLPSYERTGETWIFDTSEMTWTEISLENSPPRVSDPSLYYDPELEKVILFGGYLPDDSHSDQTWAFDPTTTTWEEIPTPLHPRARYGHSMVYDGSIQLGVLFGGRVSSITQETWTFNASAGAWQEFLLVSSPPRRYWFAMVYDSSVQQTILFGGDNEQNTLRAIGDTWQYQAESSQWTQFETTVSPSPRNNHAMVFVPTVNQSFLIGGLGEDYSVVYGDFWTFTANTGEWSLLSSASEGTSLEPFEIILLVGIPCLGILTGIIIFRRRRHTKKTSL